MTDEELILYNRAMQEGRYLDGLGIVWGAMERQEELDRAERAREREEHYVQLRLKRLAQGAQG